MMRNLNASAIHRAQSDNSDETKPLTAQLISAFVFVTWIVQSLFYPNPKFQISSHLLWVYSLVCVGPGRKPRRPVFLQRGSSNVRMMLDI